MKWVLGLICLMFIILFHELGHFIAAKILGVNVESFSIGFGPVILHKTIKGTDYRLSLFPLGGYCGMKGEKDFQKAIDEKLPTIEGDKDSLYGIHPIKRAIIGFSGPLINFLLAIVFFSLINILGYYTFSNEIVIPQDDTVITYSPAKDAGLLTGDKIIQINNTKITDFFEIREAIGTRGDMDVSVKVDRNGEILTFTIHTLLNKETGIGTLGITNNPKTIYRKSYNFFEAIGKGFTDSFLNVGETFRGLGLLFKGIDIKNAVAGPARVTDILGSSIEDGFNINIRAGFVSTFNILAFINISLFIMNLLPIPVLDGGLILFALIETIFRRKLNPKFQYYIQYVGLAFIVLVFFIGLFGDISYFIQRGTN